MPRTQSPVRPAERGATSPARTAGAWSPRFALVVLGSLAVADFALRWLQHVADWNASPFATQLSEDALRYWDWAGEISRGKLLGDTPFLSAPLYPYLLGLLRKCGAELWFVYLLQSGGHALTVFILGWIGWRRFGLGVGVLATGLYALLMDPAYSTNRLLPSTLQGLLVALLLLQFYRSAARHSAWGWLWAGILMGLLVLSYPPALVGVLLLTVWLALRKTQPSRPATIGAWLSGAGLMIFPALLHNWVVARDVIPVCAQGGVTFLQGNAPGAVGVYTIVPGIAPSRETQNQDVMRMYVRETGAPPDWQQADRFMYIKGFRYWTSEPLRITALILRKLWWFVSAFNYGDIYYPPVEARLGLGPATNLAPLPVSWLIPAAVLGLALAFRPWSSFVPELILLAAPVIAVSLFFYTPRYRLPALPILALLSAAGLHSVWVRCSSSPARQWTAGALLATSAPLISIVNWYTGFDSAALFEPNVMSNVANLLNRMGDPLPAIELFRRASRLNPQDPHIVAGLAAALIQAGQLNEAWQELAPALQAHPGNATLHEQASGALARLGRAAEALGEMQRAVELSPADARLRNNLASALIDRQRYADARPQIEEALRLRPDYVEAMLNLALVEGVAGRLPRAIEINRRALQLNPESVNGRRQLAALEQAQHAAPAGSPSHR